MQGQQTDKLELNIGYLINLLNQDTTPQAFYSCSAKQNSWRSYHVSSQLWSQILPLMVACIVQLRIFYNPMCELEINKFLT